MTGEEYAVGPASAGWCRSRGSTLSSPTSLTSAVAQTSGVATDSALYDRDRDLHYVAPMLRGWVHLGFFEVSLVVGTMLIAAAHGAAQTFAAAVYAATVSGLFGVSALYHRGSWRPAARRVLQRADHVMIVLLIAGSATPAFLLAVPGRAGVTALCVLWALALTTATCRAFWWHAPPRVVGGAYLGLGWMAGLALPPVWIRYGVAPVVLLITGGVLYTVGAVVYYRRRPDPIPTVFGYHEVFHTFVCVAATCQFLATALFIL
jgi:hemolysin III